MTEVIKFSNRNERVNILDVRFVSTTSMNATLIVTHALVLTDRAH